MKVLSVLAGAALTFLVLVALSANKANAGFGASQWRDALMGTTSGDSDRPPSRPANLKPPTPPAIEKVPAAAPDTTGTHDGSDKVQDNAADSADAPAKANAEMDNLADAHIVQIKRPQTTFEIARTYLGRSNWKTVDQIRSLNPQIRGAYQLLPAGSRVVLPGPDPAKGKSREQPASGGDSSGSHVSFTGRSNMVRVHRQETLFQFAMDQYGQSNWGIVSRIRALNPQLRDPYQILQEGQLIRVPELERER